MCSLLWSECVPCCGQIEEINLDSFFFFLEWCQIAVINTSFQVAFSLVGTQMELQDFWHCLCFWLQDQCGGRRQAAYNAGRRTADFDQRPKISSQFFHNIDLVSVTAQNSAVCRSPDGEIMTLNSTSQYFCVSMCCNLKDLFNFTTKLPYMCVRFSYFLKLSQSVYFKPGCFLEESKRKQKKCNELNLSFSGVQIFWLHVCICLWPIS